MKIYQTKLRIEEDVNKYFLLNKESYMEKNLI